MASESYSYQLFSCTVDNHSFFIIRDSKIPKGSTGYLTTLGLIPYNYTATPSDRSSMLLPDQEKDGYSRMLHIRKSWEYFLCFFPILGITRNRRYARFIKDEVHVFLDYYKCYLKDFPQFERSVLQQIQDTDDEKSSAALAEKLTKMRAKHQEYAAVLRKHRSGQWTSEDVLTHMKKRPYGHDIGSTEILIGNISKQERDAIITEYERLDKVYRKHRFFSFCYYNCLGTNFRVLENSGIAERLGLKLSQITEKIIKSDGFTPTQAGHFVALYFHIGYKLCDIMPDLGKFGKGLCFHASTYISLSCFFLLRAAKAIIKGWKRGEDPLLSDSDESLSQEYLATPIAPADKEHSYARRISDIRTETTHAREL